MENLTEAVDKTGYLFQELTLHPILCKPKLLPLKSVTLEKLENMQKEAQEKFMEMNESSNAGGRGGTGGADTGEDEDAAGSNEMTKQAPGTADVWRPEDDPESEPEH